MRNEDGCCCVCMNCRCLGWPSIDHVSMGDPTAVPFIHSFHCFTVFLGGVGASGVWRRRVLLLTGNGLREYHDGAQVGTWDGTGTGMHGARERGARAKCLEAQSGT
jgi:hypothetical protein